jgi:small subunit ribosomal protein S28e
MPIATEVLFVGENLGVKGVKRVRCRVLDGNERGRIMTRNVSGPIKKGDIVMLKDTVMDMEGGFVKRQ